MRKRCPHQLDVLNGKHDGPASKAGERQPMRQVIHPDPFQLDDWDVATAVAFWSPCPTRKTGQRSLAKLRPTRPASRRGSPHDRQPVISAEAAYDAWFGWVSTFDAGGLCCCTTAELHTTRLSYYPPNL